MSDFVEQLRQRIRKQGPLSFRDYMEEVLRFYYASPRNPIGTGGDFYTSADLDPIFGKLLAKQFMQWAAESDSFSVLELGAGKGLLARDILDHCKFPYLIFERSSAMRARQQELLRDYDIHWIDQLPARFKGCIFSNEFFDALPVHRVVQRSGALKEIYVDERFNEIERELGPIPSGRGWRGSQQDAPGEGHKSIQILRPSPCPLPGGEGAHTEINLEARHWIARIGASLDRGYHLAIDYGYLADEFYAQPRGTLMCYWQHQAVEDPYIRIGEQDITAHVNFSDLIDTGRESSLETIRFTTQMEYLLGLGILEEIERLATSGDGASMQRLVKIKRLILPDSMGQRFKVLVQTKR